MTVVSDKAEYSERRYFTFKGLSRVAHGELKLKMERRYDRDRKVSTLSEHLEGSTPRVRGRSTENGERLGNTFKPRPSLFRSIFRAVRPQFLIATAAPVAVGGAVAFYNGQFNPILLLLTLLGLSAVHLALNVANDYFDALLGADYANKRPTPFSGGSRAIVDGILKPQEARILYSALFAAGSAIGVFLAVTRGLIEVFALMGAGLFLSYFYTAPPVKLAYRGLGELAVFLGFGPVMVLGTYFVQTQTFDLNALAASIPPGMLIMLILYVNEIPDAPFDKQAGKMTLLTRISEDFALKLLLALFMLLYASIVAIALLGFGPITVLIALVTIPFSIKVYGMVKETFGEQYAMIGAMSLNVKNSALTGFLLAAGYVLGAIIG